MRRAVVVGGTGFIGRHLCRALAASNVVVTSFSRLPPVETPQGVTYLNGDVGESEDLTTACRDADCIYWVAGEATPADSANDPGLEVTCNLLPLSRFLTRVGGETDARFVYTSSGGTIYGECAEEKGPSESRTPAPLSYYGAGKAAAELFLQVFQHQHGNRITVVRPANLYGPGQPLRRQFGVIPALLSALASGSAFTCFGDGEQVRDFLYIDDAVSLMLQAGLPARDGSSGADAAGVGIYNLGSGVGVSLNTLIATAEAVTGRTLQRDSRAARHADVRASILDCRRVQEDFAWAPATTLEGGLRKTWQAMAGRP